MTVTLFVSLVDLVLIIHYFYDLACNLVASGFLFFFWKFSHVSLFVLIFVCLHRKLSLFVQVALTMVVLTSVVTHLLGVIWQIPP